MNCYEVMVRNLLLSGKFAPDTCDESDTQLYDDWQMAPSLEDKVLIAAKAIGASVKNPPKWALVACWLYSQEKARSVSVGSAAPHLPDVLDLVAFALLENEEEHWENERALGTAKSFVGQTARAIREALKLTGKGVEDRTVRRRWDDEQHAASPQASEPQLISGYRNTDRIRRVHAVWSSARSHPDGIPEEYAAIFEVIRQD